MEEPIAEGSAPSPPPTRRPSGWEVSFLVGRVGGRRWSWSGISKLLAAAAALFGIIFGAVQIYDANQLQEETNRLQRARLDSHLEEVMMALDRYFASHPHLRRFFFASGTQQALPAPGPMSAPAMGTAELIIDFADDVAAYAEMRKMDPQTSARWAAIVSGYFNQSPILRLAWHEYHGLYGPATACILGAPSRGIKFERWDWRTNLPPEEPRPCS